MKKIIRERGEGGEGGGAGEKKEEVEVEIEERHEEEPTNWKRDWRFIEVYQHYVVHGGQRPDAATCKPRLESGSVGESELMYCVGDEI
jgi:hypothetical protein